MPHKDQVESGPLKPGFRPTFGIPQNNFYEAAV
jgi:hypothetical protein